MHDDMPCHHEISYRQSAANMANRKLNRSLNKTETTGTSGREQGAFCKWDGNVLVLNVLGTPAAKRNAIGKPKGSQLKISVNAAAEDGKATDHMVRFLAQQFDVAVKDIEVVFGQYNINKQLRIRSPKRLPEVVARELAGSAADGIN